MLRAGRDASAVPSSLLGKLVCMQDMRYALLSRLGFKGSGGGTITYYLLGRLRLCLLQSIYCKS